MLIKLIVVSSNHLIRYKCKTTSRNSNITRLSNIIWIYITIVDNEKLSINEVIEVIIGVGTFSSKSSFDTQCLLFVTINELKKSMSAGLQFFLFHMVVSHSVCFLLEFKATSHNAMYVGRVVVFFHQVKHNLHIALINNTPPNSFSVDFIHFRYPF